MARLLLEQTENHQLQIALLEHSRALACASGAALPELAELLETAPVGAAAPARPARVATTTLIPTGHMPDPHESLRYIEDMSVSYDMSKIYRRQVPSARSRSVLSLAIWL